MVGEDGEPLPSCGDSIFTHPVVDLEDANPFFLVNKGYPHDHMVYWGTRKFYDRESPPPVGVLGTEQVQLYAPADIYHMQVSRNVNESHDGGTFVEWSIGASICEGYKLGFGHVGRPAEEILSEVRKAVPFTDCPVSTTEEALVTTEVAYCQWGLYFNPPFSAGTPISKSSGYAAGFDFGLSLLGLNAEELRQQPSYGYAINPWAYSGGVAVCPLEYFPEPYRTAYLDSMAGSCGLFNQDVPGTAMGVWLPFPPPADGSVPGGGPGTVWHFLPRESDLYLWEDSVDESVHKLISGGQLTGVPAGSYWIETVSDGLANREWDSVVPGDVYCAELGPRFGSTVTEVVLVEVSDDGRTLTIEGITGEGITGKQCPEGPYSFSPDAHRRYR